MELGIRCGVATRMVVIDEAIPPAWHSILRGELPLPPREGWFATFASDGKPLVIIWGSLIFVSMEQRTSDMHIRLHSAGCVPVHLQPTFHWQPIRVVGSKGKRCTVDPVFPCQEASLWRLWIWEGRPLAQLVSDPGKWLWLPGQRGEESPSFFEYTARIGRRLMLCFQSVPHYPQRL